MPPRPAPFPYQSEISMVKLFIPTRLTKRKSWYGCDALYSASGHVDWQAMTFPVAGSVVVKLRIPLSGCAVNRHVFVPLPDWLVCHSRSLVGSKPNPKSARHLPGVSAASKKSDAPPELFDGQTM